MRLTFGLQRPKAGQVLQVRLRTKPAPLRAGVKLERVTDLDHHLMMEVDLERVEVGPLKTEPDDFRIESFSMLATSNESGMKKRTLGLIVFLTAVFAVHGCAPPPDVEPLPTVSFKATPKINPDNDAGMPLAASTDTT